MPSNTKENGFETLIVDTLVNSNGYEQGVTTEYNKQYAIDEGRLFRFLLSTQKKAMDELHILDSDLEKDRFFKQLDKKLKSDKIVSHKFRLEDWEEAYRVAQTREALKVVFVL